MASESRDEGILTRWYRSRIGDPIDRSEPRGYWVFIVGVLVALAGIALSLLSEPVTDVRRAGIALAAIGLTLLLVGHVLRLPLRRTAQLIAYSGAVVSLVAVAWFLVVYPGGWDPQTGNLGIILLYVAGAFVVATGAVVGRLIIPPEDPELLELRDRTKADHSTIEQLRAEIAEKEARIAELAKNAEADAETVESLRREVAEKEARIAELATDLDDKTDAVESLRREVAENESRIDDLTDRLGADTEAIAALEADVEAKEVRIEELEADLAAGESTVRGLETDVEASEEEIRELTAAIADDETEIAELSADKESLAAAVLALREELDATRDSKAQFEIYEDAGGEHRWRLRHENGNVIAASGQGYTDRRNAQKGLDSVRRNALGGTVVRIDDPETADGEPLVHVIESASEFEVFEEDGEFHWELLDREGTVLARSHHGYASERNARRAVESVRNAVGPATYLEVDPTAFQVYQDRAGEWRWRMVHRNGKVLADSGQGYASRRDARAGLDRIQADAAGASVERVEE